MSPPRTRTPAPWMRQYDGSRVPRYHCSMNTPLFDAVRHHADDCADAAGIAHTPLAGVTAIRAAGRTALNYEISRPLICLVLQGSKHVMLGSRSFTFHAGQSLLITADVPTASQIVEASLAAPYYSLVIELDTALIAELSGEMEALGNGDDGAVRIDTTEAQVEDTARRLMLLLRRPASIALLQAAHLRELHYWLLAGRRGAAIRRLGQPDSRLRRVGRAIALLRAQFAQRLPVRQLAAVADMSPSSFHTHFRSITSLTPLQFQKQLRLIEARRLMLADGANASNAAFAVGYESVQQFTREYGRMFGMPPRRDVVAMASRHADHETRDSPLI